MIKDNKFLQGYVCAVVALIHTSGLTREAVQLFRSGVGNRSIAELKEAGVDSGDIDTINQYHDELYQINTKPEEEVFP